MYSTNLPLVVTSLFDLKDLVSRPLADELFAHIQACNRAEVAVDFSGITTISRAFADQFHKNKMHTASNGKTIVALNMETAVESMFNAVSNTQGSFNREFKSTPILKFQNRKELEEFLLSF